jgi:hypothetical protein
MTRLRSFVSAIGLEGAFLAVGTALIAIASGYLSPAGPFFVVGTMCVLVGIVLTVPPRRG